MWNIGRMGLTDRTALALDPDQAANALSLPPNVFDAEVAPAAGVSVFELARIMGTSVRMIERHYGALLDGAGADIARRLDTFETERERAADG